MTESKVIETIKKCLALANNNPSEEEARAAALKAQQLLAKYKIELADVEEEDGEEIVEYEVWYRDCVKGVARAWKYDLASIVSVNFRCKHFFYGKKGVCFYGHKTDAEAAAEVFKFLFATGDRLADRAMHKVIRSYHSRGESAQVSGIYNSWVKGFLVGLKESFDKQSTALMIIIPEDVKQQFVVRSAKFKTASFGMRASNLDVDAFSEGKRVGKDIMAARSLEN